LLNPGTLVARAYKICHLIAEGGMAEVYLARHQFCTDERRWVAIKRLKPDFNHCPDLKQSFIEEAELIISLKHPNIVRGFCHVEENNEQFIIMEHVQGRALGDLSIALKKLSPPLRFQVVIALGIAIGDALSYLHEALFIHADISPQIIMRSPKERDRRLLCGNARYMSPEQRRGDNLTESSDIYSLAQVLLEILSEIPHSFYSHEARDLINILNIAGAQIAKKRFHNCRSLCAELKAIAPLFEVEEPRVILKPLFSGRARKKTNRITWRPWPGLIAVSSVFLFLFLPGGCFGG
jgi:serine/threonine protein kinase